MFIQSQDDSHCCYSFLMKVVILMMKLKYSICCGLDVHKNVIVATIVITNKDGVSEYKQKSFSTISSDIQKFHNWLIENHCYHVCMESTGKYWIPIFNYLENDIEICLTHPKYVKAIKGKKTDKKDSKWIADLYKFDLVRCSFIPPKDFRQLRELARYRFKLVCMKSSEKNRIQNCGSMSILWTKKVERLCYFFEFLILLLLWCQITDRAMDPFTVIPCFYVFKDCSASFL